MATKNPRWPPQNSVFDISTSDGGDFLRIIKITLFSLSSIAIWQLVFFSLTIDLCQFVICLALPGLTTIALLILGRT